MIILDKLRTRFRHIQAETFALYLAARHAKTPWYAKLFTAAVVAYAVSPIDLIPDFVPVLGYLDDLILIPLGIAAAIRMIPPQVLDECREQARKANANTGSFGQIAAVVVVGIWLILAASCARWVFQVFAMNTF